jgi:hypothetical protein
MSRLLDLLLLRGFAPRDRRAVMLGLAVLLPALLYTAALRPYRAALGELRERSAAERALLQREEALLAAGAGLPGRVDELRGRAHLASLRLVRAANVPLAEAEVTGFLEEIATLSRVLLQEMRGIEPRRGEVPAAGALRPIRLALRGESDLEGVLTFLQRVESSPLLLRIAELSMEPRYEGGARGAERRPTGVVAFTLVVDAFAPPDIEQTASPQEVQP